jgi:hypothetical protein
LPRPKRLAGKRPAPASAPEGSQWLTDLAKQLDGVIQEDPQKRSAGTLIIRSLIRQAVKGDVKAIRECLRLSEQQAKARPPEPLPSPLRGRPTRDIDLAQIQEMARLGMRDITKIGRCLGVPKQTLLGPKHAEQVREAFETGRALFEQDALHEYKDDIKHSRRNPLVIFKMKQIGWSDRLVQETTVDLTEGVRERLREVVLKFRAKQTAEEKP